MGLLDLDHASDSNLLKMVLNLEQRIQEIERAMPSGFFDHGSTGSLMSLPGGASLPEEADVYADGEITMGVFRRMLNVYGLTAYTDHFRSGAVPTGFAWAGGVFTTPTVEWNVNGTYMYVTPTSTGQHFLYDSISSYTNKEFVARWFHQHDAAAGIRLDNGTDNYYTEIYTWHSGSGQMKLSTRHRAGGAATETDWITGMRADIPISIRFLLYNGTGPLYYLVNESVLGSVATTPNIGWTPSRVGLLFQEGHNGTGTILFDWFYSDFA